MDRSFKSAVLVHILLALAFDLKAQVLEQDSVKYEIPLTGNISVTSNTLHDASNTTIENIDSLILPINTTDEEGNNIFNMDKQYKQNTTKKEDDMKFNNALGIQYLYNITQLNNNKTSYNKEGDLAEDINNTTVIPVLIELNNITSEFVNNTVNLYESSSITNEEQRVNNESNIVETKNVTGETNIEPEITVNNFTINEVHNETNTYRRETDKNGKEEDIEESKSFESEAFENSNISIKIIPNIEYKNVINTKYVYNLTNTHSEGREEDLEESRSFEIDLFKVLNVSNIARNNLGYNNNFDNHYFNNITNESNNGSDKNEDKLKDSIILTNIQQNLQSNNNTNFSTEENDQSKGENNDTMKPLNIKRIETNTDLENNTDKQMFNVQEASTRNKSVYNNLIKYIYVVTNMKPIGFNNTVDNWYLFNSTNVDEVEQTETNSTNNGLLRNINILMDIEMNNTIPMFYKLIKLHDQKGEIESINQDLLDNINIEQDLIESDKNASKVFCKCNNTKDSVVSKTNLIKNDLQKDSSSEEQNIRMKRNVTNLLYNQSSSNMDAETVYNQSLDTFKNDKNITTFVTDVLNYTSIDVNTTSTYRNTTVKDDIKERCANMSGKEYEHCANTSPDNEQYDTYEDGLQTNGSVKNQFESIAQSSDDAIAKAVSGNESAEMRRGDVEVSDEESPTREPTSEIYSTTISETNDSINVTPKIVRIDELLPKNDQKPSWFHRIFGWLEMLHTYNKNN